MKKILIAALALAAVAACNKSEVVEQNPANAIAFDNAFVDNSTKSVSDPSYTKDNMFNDFKVCGFVEGAKLFTDSWETVSKSGTAWTYSNTQYWIAGAKYNFAAVAPVTGANWNATSCEVADNAINTTLSFTNNGTQDVLYAEHEQYQGKVSGNETIDFTFRHILSKVKFSFENGYNASNATIKVKDIKINNAYRTASVDLTSSTSTWKNHETSTLVLEFGMATDNEATTDANENVETAYAFGSTYESQKEFFLIPGAVPTQTINDTTTEKEVAGYNVTFTVELLVSNSVVATYNHTAYVDFTPAAGTSYDIKAVINAENIDPENEQELIEFTVNTLPDWGTTTDINAQ